MSSFPPVSPAAATRAAGLSFEHIALVGERVQRVLMCRRDLAAANLALIEHVLSQVAKGEEPALPLVIAAHDAASELQASLS